MNKTERELEFLKIKREDVKELFNYHINNHKHTAIYLVALVGVFSGVTFSLGYTKSIPFIIFGGLAFLCYKLVMVWINTNELNKLGSKINNSMDKRFEKLGVNVKEIKKEINLKD